MFWIIIPFVIVNLIFSIWFHTKRVESNWRFFYFVFSILLSTFFVIFSMPDRIPSIEKIKESEDKVMLVKLSKGKIDDRKYYTLLNKFEDEMNKLKSKRKKRIDSFNFWLVLPWNQ